MNFVVRLLLFSALAWLMCPATGETRQGGDAALLGLDSAVQMQILLCAGWGLGGPPRFS